METYHIFGQSIQPWDTLLLALLPSLIFLCLYRREDRLRLLLPPVIISVVLSAVVYRVGWNLAVVEAGPFLLLSGGITVAVWYCWRHPDLREHTVPMACATTLAVVLYRVGTNLGSMPGWTLGGASLGFGLVLFVICAFHSIINRTINDFFGGLIVDMIFSGEKVRREKKLPSLPLLHHWRKQGWQQKAYRTASRNLMDRADAYPLWLFAAETAAQDHKLSAAEDIIRRLCQATTFSRDQKQFAWLKLKDWADAANYRLGKLPLPELRKHVHVPKPLTIAFNLHLAGRYHDAEIALLRLLAKEPENLSASLLLMQVYAEDLNRPEKADKVLTNLTGKDFVPETFVEFATRSIAAWSSRMPATAARPRSWFSQWVPLPHRSGSRIRINRTGYSTNDVLQSTDERLKTPARLIDEGRLGTALEKLERRITVEPNDFSAWLQTLEIYALHVGDRKNAHDTYFKILTHTDFTQAQRDAAERMMDQGKQHRGPIAVCLR